jgi:predicted O-methyltransferase YrrM
MVKNHFCVLEAEREQDRGTCFKSEKSSLGGICLMNVLEKLVRGDCERKTRLHDEKGNLISLTRLIKNAPKAYLSGLGRILLDHRPNMPWIAYDAIEVLTRHLTVDSRVLEFGSGMSTIWFARRAAYVRSVENYRPWFDKVHSHINKMNLLNVDYIFATSIEEYTCAGSSGDKYDLIMVDGAHRSDCISRAIPLLKPQGILYLDNSDKDTRTHGDVQKAEQLCVTYAKNNRLSYEYYTDFAPTQFTPNQGLLIRNSA